MLFLTSYIFLNELLKKLDMEYEAKRREDIHGGDLMFQTDKAFFYANIINFLSINDKYDVSSRLLESLDSLEGETIDYIKQRKFDREIIQIALALVSIKDFYDTISDEIKDYSKNDLRDLDYIFAKSNNVSSKNILKTFDLAFVIEFKEYDFIKFLINKEIKFPLGEKMLEHNIAHFKKAVGRNRLSRALNKKDSYLYYSDFDGKNIEIKRFIEKYKISINKAYDRAKKYLDYIYLK